MGEDALFAEVVATIRSAATSEPHRGHVPSFDSAESLRKESTRRLIAAGHDQLCADSIYARAYETATAILARRTPDLPSCTCFSAPPAATPASIAALGGLNGRPSSNDGRSEQASQRRTLQ